MKRILNIAVLALLVVLGSSTLNTISAQYYDDQYDNGPNSNYGNDREVSYQTFYDELSPHGRWIEYPGHGYVWVPDVEQDFRPYSSKGHWVWTDDHEWMWVSDYDWGWAPFHYGRWDHDAHYGWYWVPGYEWAPAWVAWRDGGDYYGWAPIRPGINISINFNIGNYSPPVNFWCFSPRRYITSPRLYDYCVDQRRNVTIIHQTTVIVNNYRYGNNYGFRSGPRRYDAERYIGRINPVRFRETYRPSRTTFRNNEVTIYRPNVRRDADRTIAPRRFDRYDASNTNRTRSDSRFRTNDDSRVNTNSERRTFGDRQDRTIERRNSENTQNGRFERRDSRPETVNTPTDRPQRTFGNNGNENRRFERREDQPVRQQSQPQPQQPQVERRRFEKREDQPVRQQSQPQPQQQMERRKFERREDQPVRQQSQPQPQPQQMERRKFERRDDAVRPQQQIERRQEVRTDPQPSRQFERRDNGSGDNRGKGNGNGKRKFD